jgi:hypothetical protein
MDFESDAYREDFKSRYESVPVNAGDADPYDFRIRQPANSGYRSTCKRMKRRG